MSDFINTITTLGDETTLKNIIERTITEFKDNKISEIAPHAFSSCSNLTVLDMPSALHGGKFLDGCTNLKSINLPSLIPSSQDDFNFTNLENLISINMDSSSYVYPMEGCSNLVYASFNSATEMSENALTGCLSLEEITLPRINTIHTQSISDTALTRITLPSLELIKGDYAISGNDYLTSISIPTPFHAYGEGNFSSNPELVDLLLPEFTGPINASFAASCPKLVNLMMPKAGGYIGSNAFGNCQKLTVISLPAVDGSVLLDAFHQCTSLTTLDLPNAKYVSGNASNLKTDYGWISLKTINLRGCITLMENALAANSSLTRYPMLEQIDLSSLQNLGTGALSGLTQSIAPKLTTLILPSLATIQENALAGSTCFKNITLRADTISSRALASMKLDTLRFTNKPTTINYDAFQSTTITDLYVPWGKDEITGFPWGGTFTNIHYNAKQS